MGRPKGSRNSTKGTGLAKPKKHKKVTIEPAERMNAGRVIAPYRIMESLIDGPCKHLADARIAIAWRKGWPAVQDRIKLGQMKMASDCDRAYKDYDFLMLLNAEVYRQGANEESLTMTIHWCLLCGAPALDREGEQKTDEKGRACWNTRKPPIVQFPEILKIYGIEKVLGLTVDAITAAKEGPRPLLDAIEKAGSEKAATTEPAATNGDGEAPPAVNPKAWRRWPVSCLGEHGLPAGKVKILDENGLGTMGKLLDRMNKAGIEDFWWKDLRGMGEGGYDSMVNAIMALRKAKPEFQADLTEAVG